VQSTVNLRALQLPVHGCLVFIAALDIAATTLARRF